MRSVAVMISVGIFVFSVSLFGHDWPLKPFDEQHQINSTFGEYRTGHFHKGVDIKPFGSTPTDTFWLVYSVLSDTAYHTNGANPGIRVGKYYYIHLRNRVDSLTYVTAFTDTIGRVDTIPGTKHLHFHWTVRYPPAVDTVINPLRAGALSPYVDSTNPHIDSIFLYRQASDSLLSDTLDRRVDILCVAGDTRTDTTGHDAGDNVSVYRIGYEVKDTSGNSLRSWEKIRFDTIPDPSNDTTLGLTYHDSSTLSHFRYWVTNDPFNPNSNLRNWYWNTKQKASFPDSVDADSVENAKFPRGNYWVKVLAYDIRDNGALDSVKVYVDNFPPRVDSVFPSNGAVDVPTNTEVVIWFDEPMDESVNLRNAIVFSPGVSGYWAWQDDRTAVFTVNPAFQPDTEYRVKAIANDLKDLVGRTLDGNRDGISDGSPTDDYEWSFTTAGEEDYGGPYPEPLQWEGATEGDWSRFSVSRDLFPGHFPFYGSSPEELWIAITGSIWFHYDWDLRYHFDLPTAGGHPEGVIAVYNDSIRGTVGFPDFYVWLADQKKVMGGDTCVVAEWAITNRWDVQPPSPFDSTYVNFEAILSIMTGAIRLDYRKNEYGRYQNDGGSGISAGDTFRYLVLDSAYTLHPGSYLFTTNPPPGGPYGTHPIPAASVGLKWEPNPEPDIWGYNVYRGAHPDSLAKINDTLITTGTSYTDTTAQPGAIYHYAVTAVDTFAWGQESYYSDIIEVMAPPFSSDCSTATAFNNARKLVFGADSISHLVFQAYQNVWYSYSPDFGSTWCPAIPLGRGALPAIALDSQNRPHVIWASSLVPWHMSYAQRLTDQWRTRELYTTEDTLFAPSFAIDQYDSGRVAFTYSKAENNNLTYGCFYTQALPEGLLHETVLDTFDGFSQASIATMDSDTSIHIAYEKAERVYHIWRDAEGNWGRPEGFGRHHFPSVGIGGELCYTTWEYYWSPAYTKIQVVSWHKKGLGIFLPGPADTVMGRGCFPVIEEPVVVCWGGLDGANWEIWRRVWSDSGWRPVENISQTTAASKHPHFAFYQLPDTTRVITTWTEGDSAPFWIRLESEEIPPAPLYAANLGQEDPSPFTIERGGHISYGNAGRVFETVDYHSDQLSYRLAGLNPQRFYRLDLLYYHDDSSSMWEEEAIVDGQSMDRAKVEGYQPRRTSLWLPENTYSDGGVFVDVKNVNHGKAVLAALTLYEFMDSGGNTKVEEKYSLPVKIGRFSLRQVPNPAKGGTTIYYHLPTRGLMSLKIYNIAGSLVKVLDEGHKLPGAYSVYWNGRDQKGNKVASGVYFIRLKAGRLTRTKKAVLLR